MQLRKYLRVVSAAAVAVAALGAVPVLLPAASGTAAAESGAVSGAGWVRSGRTVRPQVEAGSLVTAAPAGTSKAVQLYGRPRSGLAWQSGFWTGGSMSTARMNEAQAWIGHPFDFVTTYPESATWSQITGSESSIGLFDGFGGRLSYGLPLLPADRRGHWEDVTSGANDAVFREVARQLVAHGRGDSAIRVGVEANGDWFPYAATAATADKYKAAFRRVVTLMRAEAPHLTFWFDLAAGFGLQGGHNRLDVLTLLYPGDAYVDGVSMDHYDFTEVAATSAAAWRTALQPPYGAGLGDAVVFARAHGKGFSVPEWGLHGTQGPGDNPYFVQQMHAFFVANADVLVYECYFNEPDTYIRNAIWGPVQMPKSSAMYRALF